MIKDMIPIIWKEYKELISDQGNIKNNLMGIIVFTGITGIFLPLKLGPAFFENIYLLFFYVWFPIFLVLGMVMDSFAGERERNTLETLLASRLSDHAILFGKIFSCAGYGLAMTVIFMATGVIVANIVFFNGSIVTFPLETVVLILLTATLVNVFIASTGVLISLRSQTVRMSNDAMVGGIFAVTAVLFGLFYILPEELRIWMIETSMSLGTTGTIVIIAAMLLVLNAFIICLAVLSFRRSRLILL